MENETSVLNTGAPPGIPVDIWLALMQKKQAGTLTAVEQLLLDKTAEADAIKTELQDVTLEYARLEAENSENSVKVDRLSLQNDKLNGNLQELIKQGIILSNTVISSAEDLNNKNRMHFTSGAESLKKSGDSSLDVQATLSDNNEEESEGIPEFMAAINFFTSCAEKTLREKLKDEYTFSEEDDVPASTGIENFSNIIEDTDGQSSKFDAINALINDLEDDQKETRKTFMKTWASRRVGQRQEILGNIVDEYIYLDAAGNKITEEEASRPPIGINGPMKFVGFKEVFSEVTVVRAECVSTHVMTATFKETLKADQDLDACKLELQEQLGDEYQVSGVKKLIREMQSTQNVTTGECVSPDGDTVPLIQNESHVDTPSSPMPDEGTDDTVSTNDAKDSESVPASEDKVSSPSTDEKTVKAGRKDKRKQIFVTSKVRNAFIKGCYAAPSLIAFFIVYKYCLALPIYRIITGPGAGIVLPNLAVPVSVAEHWPILVYVHKLQYLLPFFREVLLAQKYLHADETVLQVLNEDARDNTTKSYLWLYSTIEGCPTAVRYFDYAPGRKGEFAKLIIGGFVGFLITDAYQGYNLIENAIHCFCMIHARRKFFAAVGASLLKSRKDQARVIVGLFDQLLQIEKNLPDCSPEERLRLREEKMRPILNELDGLIDKLSNDPSVPKKSKLGIACSYYIKHKAQLQMFMSDGNIPLHNMVAENAIRPVAVGRKNWLFCGSPKGAATLACIYTVIETAKANGLDPYAYMVYLFEHMRGNDWMNDPEYVKSLLPWAPEVQKACAIKKAA